MTKHLIGWLRWAWNAGALAIVVLALLITALRVVLPRLTHELSLVESWASRLVGAPVSIGRLEIHWRDGLPVLAAHNIHVRLAHAEGPEILRFAHAEARLDFWASLHARRIQVGNLTLSGLTLKLLRRTDNSFVVEGFPRYDVKFMRWLLAQRGLQVIDADFLVRDEQQRFKSMRASQVDFTIEAGEAFTLIEGTAGNLEAVAAPVSFRARLPRRGVRGVAPQVRLFGTDLDLHALLLKLEFKLPDLTALRADALVQITWPDLPDLNDVQIGFDFSHLDIRGVRDGLNQAPARYALRGVLAGSAAAFDVQLVHLTTDATTGGPIDWRLQLTRGAAPSLSMSADSLPLAVLPLVKPWLPRLDDAPAAVLDALHSGAIDNVRLGISGDGPQKNFYARGAVRQIHLNQGAAHPGLHDLSARLIANRHGGAVVFDHETLDIEDEHHLVEPLALSALAGSLRWQLGADAVRTLGVDLQGLVNDLPLRVRGSLSKPPAPGPALGVEVDLQVTLGTGDLTRVPTLMPLQVMHPHGDEWLRSVFQTGTVKGGQFVLRGPLASFPFDHGEGVFEASFAVEDATLHYARQWPLATGVSGDIRFTGRALAGEIITAKFFDSPLQSAKFAMEDFLSHEPVLTLNGTVRTNLPDLLQTLRESPLKQGAVSQLADFALTGAVDLGLDLRLGLKHGAEKKVLGTLSFEGNTLRATRHGLALDDLRGRLNFTREDWYGEDLTALLGTQRVGLVVKGRIGDPNYANEFRMTGTADAAQILNHLAHHAPKVHAWLAANQRLDVLKGELSWQALLATPQQGGDTLSGKRLVLESSLEGIQVALPWPLGKAALERRPLRLETPLGAEPEATLHITYGDSVQVAIQQAVTLAGPRSVQRVDAVFGGGAAPTLEREGIYLHGNLQSLPLGEWAMLLKQSAGPPSLLPMAIDLQVVQLRTLGQEFEHVSLRGHKDPVAWRIQMESARAAGEITVPNDLTSAPLTLNFERLWLEPVTSGDPKNALDPQAIPNVVLACTSFKYHTVDFGQAALATARATDGLRLQTLVFQSPSFQVRADGNWSLNDGVHHSQFSIHLTGQELGAVLQHFGYNARGIKGGKTKLDIEASWPGTPGDFTLDKLDGSLGLHVQHGRFLDIEPGSGRLFGLLSLQTLPRRLSLDFADLFQKGYAFDRIEGWFELENGNAYTNSLLMEGPSSRVEVTGRTGLAAQDYDQRVTVTPALSKSIPLASAMFGPAGIGVGAAIYLGQKVFKGIPAQVDRLLQKHYSITGAWEQPKVEKL